MQFVYQHPLINKWSLSALKETMGLGKKRFLTARFGFFLCIIPFWSRFGWWWWWWFDVWSVAKTELSWSRNTPWTVCSVHCAPRVSKQLLLAVCLFPSLSQSISHSQHAHEHSMHVRMQKNRAIYFSCYYPIPRVIYLYV